MPSIPQGASFKEITIPAEGLLSLFVTSTRLTLHCAQHFGFLPTPNSDYELVREMQGNQCKVNIYNIDSSGTSVIRIRQALVDCKK